MRHIDRLIALVYPLPFAKCNQKISKVMSVVKRNQLLFPSIVNDLLGPDWFGGTNWLPNTSTPAVNVRETESDYRLELVVPGFQKDEIQLEVDHDVLKISARHQEEKNEENERYTRREFSMSSFQRSFQLPETVNDEGISADYREGILHVTLPKREEAMPKPKRLISLN